MLFTKFDYICTCLKAGSPTIPKFILRYAGVVELVDTPDLGSGAARCESSSLSARTVKSFSKTRSFFYIRKLRNMWRDEKPALSAAEGSLVVYPEHSRRARTAKSFSKMSGFFINFCIAELFYFSQCNPFFFYGFTVINKKSYFLNLSKLIKFNK